VHRLAEDLLRRGFPLIVDATNISEKNREYLYSIAEHLGVKLILVHVEAPPELVRKRLEERQNAETRSDADWAIYQKMKSSLQPIRRNHYVVDTSKDITPVIDKIVREAEKAQF
jgi:predicted kinase